MLSWYWKKRYPDVFQTLKERVSWQNVSAPEKRVRSVANRLLSRAVKIRKAGYDFTVVRRPEEGHIDVSVRKVTMVRQLQFGEFGWFGQRLNDKVHLAFLDSAGHLWWVEDRSPERALIRRSMQPWKPPQMPGAWGGGPECVEFMTRSESNSAYHHVAPEKDPLTLRVGDILHLITRVWIVDVNEQFRVARGEQV